MGKEFVNFHTHSYYSLLEASSSPKNILKKAKEVGCPAVAITDSGVGYGLIEFYEEASRLENSPRPLLGAELFVARDSRFEKRPEIDGKEGNIVAVAASDVGYKNLVKLLSISHLEGFYHKPRIDFDLLNRYKEGIFFFSSGKDGVLGKVLYDSGEKKAEEFFLKLCESLGDAFFLEFVAIDHPRQKVFNEFLLSLLEKYDRRFIVSSNARFLNSDDEEATEILFGIGKGEIRIDNTEYRFTEGAFFKSFEEMSQILSYLGEDILEKARKETLFLADKISFQIQFGQNLLPHFEVPGGETEMSQLRKLCEANIEKRFGQEIPSVRERLEYELSVIEKMGFPSYFLIVADFIGFAKSHDIAVGPGRGSAAGSLVSYLLEITDINPLKYDLLFERFLNPERVSLPDIDIDFSDERRDEVLQYVLEKYGHEKVSKVCTFGTLSAKAALKDVGRVLGVPFSEMNAFTKILPNRPGFELENALEIKEFKDLINNNSRMRKVYDIARKLEGCVRHVSVHACAVVIGKDDLSTIAPLQWAPGSDDIKITQFPYQQLDHIGLLKMDFLGLKNLSVIEKTLSYIRHTSSLDLDLEKIPLDDKKTFEMIARGETTGVFQFESAGMRRYLKELQPTEFEDLVAMNALYRPGPMEYIPTYIKGKHSPRTVKYVHPVLEPVLKTTYGIAIYQEQIMKLAQVFSGFSLGQADILRKAIGKKILSVLEQQRKSFIEGAVRNGYDEQLALKIFDEIIVPFAGYGFNRSHAVCYAMIAYRTAYLRANYPVEFMAAMMTTDRFDTERIVLEMNECRAMGIEVLPPSINDSGSYFTVVTEGTDDRQVSFTENSFVKKIRFGLTAIKGMGEDTAHQIIFERQNYGKYKSLQDFAKRVPAKIMNKKTLEALAFSGAFDCFGDRRAIVESLEDISRFSREYQEKKMGGQGSLFGGLDQPLEFVLKNSVATKQDILKWERESLGLFVSDHPLRGLEEYLQKNGKLIGTLSLEEDEGQRRTIHGIVTRARTIITRNGKQMGVLEIEDPSGKIEIAIFPQMYEKISKKAFEIDALVRVRGKVESRDENLAFSVEELNVGNLSTLFQWKGQDSNVVFSEIYLKLPDTILKEDLEKLKSFLSSIRVDGDNGVGVMISFQGKDLKLPFLVQNLEGLQEKLESFFR